MLLHYLIDRLNFHSSVGSEGSDYDHEHHVDHKTRKKLEKKFEWKRKEWCN